MTNMKTQNNMTSLISQAEWWVKKTQVNQVRGNFNWKLYMKLIEIKRNEKK
jgi:hypothetical protein